MMKKEQINNRQLAVLIFLFTVGDAILYLPTTAVAGAKQDAWLAGIISVVVGCIVTFLYSWMGKLYPDLSLAEYSEKILGKWIGKMVILGFLFYAILSTCVLLRELGDFMNAQILPTTPIQWIIGIFTFAVTIGVRSGIETLARSAETFFPWVTFLFIIFILLLIPNVDMENARPVLEHGFKPFLETSYSFVITPFVEIFIFLMILPTVNQKDKIGKSIFFAVLLGGIFLLLVTLFSILILGVDHTLRNNYPSYLLAKSISVGHVIERIEAIFAGIWFITIYFKTSVTFYCFILGLTHVIKLNDYRQLVLPTGLIMVILSIVIAPNYVYLAKVLTSNWPLFDLTFGVFFPLLLLTVVAIKKGMYRFLR